MSLGHEVTVAIVNPNAPDLYKLDSRIKLMSIPSVLTTNNYEVVHIHGMWSPILHRVSRWAHKNEIPVVWSTHGMTAPWSMRHKWWKKWPVWHLYQKRDLRQASVIHSTTDLEAKWNKELGFKNLQTVIPLGTVLPNKKDSSVIKREDVLRVLFVGRIYPVKGLMNVVRAAVELKDCKILFRIVGPDQDGHQAELMGEAERLGVLGMFDWAGARYGEDLSDEYDNCDMLILPSFTENFGATVVDALSHGKPALASAFTPWKILEERNCGWWVSNKPRDLAKVFRAIVALDTDKLNEMGVCGRKLVEEKYTWAAVCNAMLKGYKEILDA